MKEQKLTNRINSNFNKMYQQVRQVILKDIAVYEFENSEFIFVPSP